MDIYIICPVRGAGHDRVSEIRDYAKELRGSGYSVHFPPDDAPQEDPVGTRICRAHRDAMAKCDQVHIFWDNKSSGSHFDLGMAYALGKTLVPIKCYDPGPDKSYWNALLRYGRWAG